MIRYTIVSVGSGILFGLMDGLVNANPLAQKLFRVFEPIARKSINTPAGFAIDLVYGFALAGTFLLLGRTCHLNLGHERDWLLDCWYGFSG